MKKVFKFYLFVLFFSCNKEKESEETDGVPFKLCACKEHPDYLPRLRDDIQYTEKDVYFLRIPFHVNYGIIFQLCRILRK